MQLLYIYIANYANFGGAEFNFGGPYRFSYNKVTKTLTAEENQGFIPGFYGSKVANLTAIIGENGVGKTSLLKRLALCTHPEYNLHNKYSNWPAFVSVYYGKDENLYIDGTIQPNLAGFSGNIESLWKKEDDFRPKAAYITTTLGAKSGIEDAIELGTWHLLQESLHKEFLGLQPNDRLDGKHYGRALLLGAINDEVQRQVNFLQCGLESIEGLPDFIPKKIELHVNDFPQKSIGYDIPNLHENYRKLLTEVEPNPLPTEEGKIYFTDEPYENGRTYLKLKLLDNLIGLIVIKVTASKPSEEHKNLDTKNYDLSTIKLDSVVDDSLDFVLNYLESNPSREVADATSFKENVKKALSKIDNLSLSQDGPFKQEEYYVPIEEHEQLVELNKEVAKLMEGYGNVFLVFSWHDLSSGEEAKLSIFSRVFLAKEKVKEEQNGEQPVLLLIDEGESHFHPKWQREFLNDLLKVVDKVFLEKQVHIIMTSNSPFLVSDIPKDNIIFLKKGDDGRPVVSALAEHKETFGANIHLLLADSFFMDSGTMGKFAEKKIDELIAYLDGKSTFDGKEITVTTA